MSFFRSIFNKTAAPEPQPTPVEEVQAPPAEQDLQKPVERRKRQRVNAREGVRVLVIDDSATILAALVRTLRSAGYTTLEAADAETGLEIIRREKPELVFLDIVLPGMSGFAALRLMRRDPQTQHIPVIMISGNEQAVEQFYANRIGADDFMKKPFSRAEVFARIEPLLDANLVPRRKGFTKESEAPQASATFAPTPRPEATPVAAAVPAPSLPAAAPDPAPPPPPKTVPSPAVEPVVRSFPQAPAPSPSGLSPLEARKELTAMGLQYFDQAQFVACIKRGDKLAFELFLAGGGVDIAAETDGKTPLQVARENGRTQIFALLRARLAAAG